MIDRTTKILLAAIAAGLWAHVAVWQLRPAIAQENFGYALMPLEDTIGCLEIQVGGIKNHIWDIASGGCSNSKIC
jgi:hypothetical protein